MVWVAGHHFYLTATLWELSVWLSVAGGSAVLTWAGGRGRGTCQSAAAALPGLHQVLGATAAELLAEPLTRALRATTAIRKHLQSQVQSNITVHPSEHLCPLGILGTSPPSFLKINRHWSGGDSRAPFLEVCCYLWCPKLNLKLLRSSAPTSSDTAIADASQTDPLRNVIPSL